MTPKLHHPVLLTETLMLLRVKPGSWYLDGTFGRGGHTEAILQQGGSVIAFDHDQAAIDFGQEVFKTQISAGSLILVRANFTEITKQLAMRQLNQQLAGVLFDFGTSVDQLKDSRRGFSFEGDGPLDMRMDDRLGVTAADLLNALPSAELIRLFSELGGETEAKKVASAIVNYRAQQQFTSTAQLVKLVTSTKYQRSGHLHPATKVFQALRIAVNSELDNIASSLPQALDSLAPQGRIITIAFHEGEDRIVKQLFKKWHEAGFGTLLTKKPITPTEDEVQQNQRARSAKLRGFEKKL